MTIFCFHWKKIAQKNSKKNCIEEFFFNLLNIIQVLMFLLDCELHDGFYPGDLHQP